MKKRNIYNVFVIVIILIHSKITDNNLYFGTEITVYQ